MGGAPRSVFHQGFFQIASKWRRSCVYEPPRAAQERPKSAPRAPKSAPRVPKSDQKAFKSVPRATKTCPGDAQGAIIGICLRISSFFSLFFCVFRCSLVSIVEAKCDLDVETKWLCRCCCCSTRATQRKFPPTFPHTLPYEVFG